MYSNMIHKKKLKKLRSMNTRTLYIIVPAVLNDKGKKKEEILCGPPPEYSSGNVGAEETQY